MKSADSIFRVRHYLHFDEPIGQMASQRIATDPKTVASWGFLPMLTCTLVVKKVKRVNGNLRKTEKKRPISYSSHKDAAIYSYYGHVLIEHYERELANRNLSSCVTAFRPDSGKCNIHFAQEAFEWIAAQTRCVALAFDIKSFFDCLNHGVLKKAWASILGVTSLPDDHYAVFRSLTRFATVDRELALKALGISKYKPRANKRRCLCTAEEFRSKIRDGGLIVRNPNAFGIPQGSPMSAVLSNIYLLEFDTAVQSKISSCGGLYRRYCDDMLCVVGAEYVEEVEKFVEDQIQKVQLELQRSKTMRHHFERNGEKVVAKIPLQYLGFVFNGHRVLLRNTGIGRFYSRMRAAVRLAAATRKKRGKPGEPIRRKKLNIRYSYLGGRNFISYSVRAARLMNDKSIKKQMRSHWRKLNVALTVAERAKGAR